MSERPTVDLRRFLEADAKLAHDSPIHYGVDCGFRCDVHRPWVKVSPETREIVNTLESVTLGDSNECTDTQDSEEVNHNYPLRSAAPGPRIFPGQSVSGSEKAEGRRHTQ